MNRYREAGASPLEFVIGSQGFRWQLSLSRKSGFGNLETTLMMLVTGFKKAISCPDIAWKADAFSNSKVFHSFLSANAKKLMLVCLGVLFLAGCSTNYYRYEGAPVLRGQGGALKTVDGIDIWIEGTPPKEFQVIGVITDNRPGGPIPMATRDAQVAAKARTNGGDAVLLQFDERELMGFHSLGSSYSTGQGIGLGVPGAATAYGSLITTGSGLSRAIDRHKAKYYVIKYQ